MAWLTLRAGIDSPWFTSCGPQGQLDRPAGRHVQGVGHVAVGIDEIPSALAGGHVDLVGSVGRRVPVDETRKTGRERQAGQAEGPEHPHPQQQRMDPRARGACLVLALPPVETEKEQGRSPRTEPGPSHRRCRPTGRARPRPGRWSTPLRGTRRRDWRCRSNRYLFRTAAPAAGITSHLPGTLPRTGPWRPRWAWRSGPAPGRSSGPGRPGGPSGRPGPASVSSLTAS